jgi:hypothetical protein
MGGNPFKVIDIEGGKRRMPDEQPSSAMPCDCANNVLQSSDLPAGFSNLPAFVNQQSLRLSTVSRSPSTNQQSRGVCAAGPLYISPIN